MAKTVLTNVRCFAVAVDLTGVSNKIEVSSEVEAKDSTNYASEGYKEVMGGLASAEISGEGQWEAGDPTKVDDGSWSQLGGVGPWSISANNSAAVGSLAYFTSAMRSEYKLGEAVGEVAPWTGTAKSAWPLVRGQFAHPPGTARTYGIGLTPRRGRRRPCCGSRSCSRARRAGRTSCPPRAPSSG